MLQAIDVQMSSMLGVASMYTDLDAELALQRPCPRAPCLACDNRSRAVHSNARYLLGALAKPRGAIAQTYPRSQGLCLPHFHQTWEIGGPPQARVLLLVVQRRVTRTTPDLCEFIRKEGTEARHEPRGA